jgi:transcriptional regulator with XRE-family HTH domain
MTNVAPVNRLEDLREEAGISRAGLADFLGLGEHQVRRWEAGETLIPTKHLPALTEKFGVSSDYLLGLGRSDTATQEAAA